MNKIVWSPQAEDAYLSILETTYHFSTNAALALDERLENLLERLRQFKHVCPPSASMPGLRRCVVTKFVSLVYEVIGDTIQILMVFDNRMDNG